MGAIANLTAQNAELVPVVYTFTPAGRTKDGYWIFEQTVPTPANSLAAARVHIRLTRDSMNMSSGSRLGGAARVHAKLWIPTMETLSTNDAGITPPPTVAYTDFVETSYVLPERGIEQGRKNLREIASRLYSSNTILQEMVFKLQDLW